MSTPSATGNARSSLAMIAACFRHQHPEAFGRDPVPGVVLPITLRYGRDEITQSPPRDALPEESGSGAILCEDLPGAGQP